MKLFYEKRIIHSSKSSARISAILSDATGKWPLSEKDFYGKVEDGKFKLCPTFSIGRPCTILCGTISEKVDGCDVEIEAKPPHRYAHLASMVLFGIISAVSLISGISSLIANGFTSDAMSELLVLPFVAALFALFHFDFSSCAKKAFKHLEELLL